jgi:ribosomal protein S8
VGKQLYTGDQVGDVLIWNGEGKAIKKFRTLPKSKSIQNIFSIQLDEKPHLLMSVEVDNAGRLSSHIFCCNLQGKEVLWEKLENKPIIYLAKFNEHTIVCVYADRPNIALIISKEGVTSLSHKNEIRNLCTDNGLIFTSTEEGIMIWRDSGSCLNVIRKTLFKMHVANLKIYVGSLNIGQVSVLDFSKSLKHSIQQLTTNFSNEVFLAYPQDVKNSIYKIYFYVRNMQGAVNDPLNTGKILFHMSDSLEGELGQIKKQAIQCYLWLSELEKKIQQGDGPGAKEIYDKLPEKLREAEFV